MVLVDSNYDSIIGFMDLSHLITNGQAPREICVETRMGTKLEATIESHPADFGILNQFRFFLTENGSADWVVKSDVDVNYNCAGMVWASRRAALPNPTDWECILAEDGYREIEFNQLENDDIVVYFLSDELEHVGRVVKADRTDFFTCRVLSKFGMQYGEIEHSINDSFIKKMNWETRYYTHRHEFTPTIRT